mgnify:CR=1 FL=1
MVLRALFSRFMFIQSTSKSINLVTTAFVTAPNKVSESDVNNNKIKVKMKLSL